MKHHATPRLAAQRLPRRLLATILALAAGCTAPDGDAPQEAAVVDRAAETAAVERVLNDLHRLASDADFDAYFQLFAEDAVFMGTDATERWSIPEFQGYAIPADGTPPRGWTYEMTERHVYLDADANSAWFDERLDNANYGETRGTGTLIKTEAGWRITQYNLTIPVPNDLAADLVARIRDAAGG
jgi:hypothetical protein